ncbi:MAG: fimbrillin family protein [Bacteroidales bacterium]|nr:fimbrillin family protein [Bacteroidales bacterium]
MKKFVSLLVTGVILPLACIKSGDNLHQEHYLKFISYGGPLTKGQIPFTTGNRSSILVFEAESLCGYFGGTPVIATGGSDGELLPQNSIALVKGSYDIYTVSLNNSQNPSLVFENGLSKELENGRDYLWASQKNVTVNSDKVIVFNYKRLACLVTLKVKADTYIKNLVIKDMKLSVPKTDSIYMNLSQGKINSSTLCDSLISLAGSGSERSVIIVPKKGPTDIEIEVDATINGLNIRGKKYSAVLDIEFTSGNSYMIELEIVSDKIAAVTTSVSVWRLKNNLVIFTL